ncbi:hypothetical protein CCHR01_03632 [Colletotrichum chrysophilum]|uniref:Uncharacterized protein n=1 Tax=Colletotrichum chrysophilum TaxID=1836956 RepID=A0AAD9EJ87_9PEZI|nr:hypothetical protein CCHR01_03632 [Colletotrichum chrysophilum]
MEPADQPSVCHASLQWSMLALSTLLPLGQPFRACSAMQKPRMPSRRMHAADRATTVASWHASTTFHSSSLGFLKDRHSLLHEKEPASRDLSVTETLSISSPSGLNSVRLKHVLRSSACNCLG